MNWSGENGFSTFEMQGDKKMSGPETQKWNDTEHLFIEGKPTWYTQVNFSYSSWITLHVNPHSARFKSGRGSVLAIAGKTLQKIYELRIWLLVY